MIEVVNESDYPVDEVSIAEQARFVLDRLRIHPQAELSVMFVDESAMTDLHVTWMDEGGPTDVLSFPMDELRPPREGEPMVEAGIQSPDQASAPTLPARLLVCELLTHGCLHLLGYDHAEPDEERLMFGLQNRLVAEWNALVRLAEGEAR